MKNKPVNKYQQRGILGRLFSGGSLKIKIENQIFEFQTTTDFRRFLSTKTEITASQVQKMLQNPDPHLIEEVKQLTQVEHNINKRLADTIRDPKSIDSYLNDMTMVRFSRDSDWRQIMFELSKQPTDFSEFKLEAVTAYRKYLQSRINILKDIIKDRDSHTKIQASVKEGSGPMETLATSTPIGDSGATESSEGIRAPTIKADYADFSKQEAAHAALPEFKRIPRGQTVIVEIGKISRLPIKIASHEFVIDSSGPEPVLISLKGDRYILKPRENLIGRSKKCSTILDSELDDISRQHLIIECYPDKTLHFTDLSSAGTRLPEKYL